MSNRRIVDTNLIVRHLVQDEPKHAATASRLFDACDRGEVTLVILPAVVAECVFVLESFYEHPRSAIAQVMTSLLASPGMELPDLTNHLDALHRYRTSKLHFVDCMIAATAAGNDVPVATFDRGFGKFPDVRTELD